MTGLRIEIEVAVSRDTAEIETAFGIAPEIFAQKVHRAHTATCGAESGQYYTDATPA
jgi:hypothetical protein